MRRIDLSADVGEGGDDRAVFELVTSVSIACGAHAGDEGTMERSVALALRHGVAIGAHPSYPDREGFGRRPIAIAEERLAESIADQIRSLAAVAARRGARLGYVKPHGALYNEAAGDPRLARVVAEAVAATDRSLRLVGLADSALVAAAIATGLEAVPEAFADRRYLASGRLAPRSVPGAVVEDPEEAARQAIAIATGGAVTTLDGSPIVVEAATICIHADTPGAARIARAVRDALRSAGAEVRPFAEPAAG